MVLVTKRNILAAFAVCLIFIGCSSDGTDEPDVNPTPTPTTASFQRSAMLENWADNIIIPAYQEMESSLSDLETAFNDLNINRDEVSLVAFREAWIASYFVWQRVSMFEVGPAEAIGYRLNMNIYPADATQIAANVASGTADLSLPSNRDTKGFPAIDYLINGLGTTDTTIIAEFNAASGTDITDYLDALITDMQTLTSAVLQEWEGTFRDAFVADDGSSVTASVDRYVNDYIFYYERFLRAGKIGIPAGVFSGSILPQNVEAFYIGTISNELFLEGLDAVQDFFNGIAFNSTSDGVGLDDYLNSLGSNGEQLTGRINDQYNLSRDMVTALNSFQTELETDPPVNLLLAYDEVQRIVPLIKVDMLSLLNINVDFQDADGD